MTTHGDGQRLKAAWQHAIYIGDAAYYRDVFRNGQVVRFVLAGDLGDGPNSAMQTGDFQLRLAPGPLKKYGVFARMGGDTAPDAWIMVDGPWALDTGPFHNR